jgi:aminocarboxymuconate-semialdehyde decarboxylase
MTTAGVVDVHSHAIACRLPALDEAHPYDRWPSVTRTGERTAEIRVGRRHFRDIDDRCWSPSRRIEDMDREGVAVQVLSPVPITLCHHAPAAGASELAQAQNDFLAGMVDAAPGRFKALGAVPLQEPTAAVAELRRCVEDLGFLGVEIGTSVGGRELADPSLEMFFSAAADLDALVFVHPDEVLQAPRLAPWGLSFGVGIPVETAIAASALLASGLLERFGNLRVCLAHGGGALAMMLPRIERGWSLDLAPAGPRSVLPAGAAARRFYVDSLTYDDAALDLILRRFGENHVMLGTDYPFAAREYPPGEVLTSSGRFPKSVVDAVQAGNVTALPRWRSGVELNLSDVEKKGDCDG